MPKSLVARIRLLYLPLDLLFGILIPLALVNGIAPENTLYALIVLYVVGLGRSAILNILFGRLFGPIGRWLDTGQFRPDARDVRAIDTTIRRAPVTLGMWLGTLWFCQLMIGTVFLLYVDPYKAGIPPRALVTAILMSAAAFLGSIPFMVPLIAIFLNDAARAVFAVAHKAGIPLEREQTSLKLKLVWLTASIGLAGPLWMASTSYSADAARAVVEARADCELAATRLAHDAAAADPKDAAQLARLVQQAQIGGLEAYLAPRTAPPAEIATLASPPAKAWLAMPAPAPGADDHEYRAKIIARDREVAARAVAPNGLVAIVVAPVADWASSSMVVTLIAFFAVIIAWAPLCAYFLAIQVVNPLRDMTRAIQQITEVGKLDEVSSISVTHNDEAGALGARFNDLIDMLRDLSAAAAALAVGDLEIRLEGEGDVATAFRSMIESLGRIVRQIHETSILLAAAATEIYAASQEQEAAAASQSTAMVEIRQTMESLFEAAAHVSESVRGVLSNAERTLETTDRMVVRIGDLTNHAGRIGEILETIRDISDRSDLLALNGALEASRAGEAGRGFGLVAAEMRRLAERVMSSVHDVRSLVGDIRASGSSTMMATEDSKKLAASTTDAARQITLVTQQQRSGTEQVLQSVREIAETLTQSVAAMAQTRASAEQLKSQADKLSSLVRAFRIETTPT
jgi:methyl-accepting chemotaxis protein